ncbi:MAG: GAP family protein [Gemmatimonas sp.]|nr:GAP family protein [Gemmatimonas sp.]
MGQAIGGVLSEAIGVAISPVPIIAMVLLLSSTKGKSDAVAFLVAWLLGLAVVGTIVLLVASPDGSDSGGRPAWVGWLLLGLGLLVLFFAFRQWRHRPKGDESPPMPKWMEAINDFSVGRAAGMGFILAAINPKNTTLTLAAAAAIATSGVSSGEAFVSLAVFVVIGTLGLAVPLGISLFGGDRAADKLDNLHDWLAKNNPTIMTVLFLVIGAKLVGNGLQTLL